MNHAELEFALVDFYINNHTIPDYLLALANSDIQFGSIDVDELAELALTFGDNLDSAIEAYLGFQPTDEGLVYITEKVNFDFMSFFCV
jgi:hypothetical protein